MDDFDSYNDFDPTAFADDYNVWEEEQVFQDGVTERAWAEAEAMVEDRWRDAERHSEARRGHERIEWVTGGYMQDGVVVTLRLNRPICENRWAVQVMERSTALRTQRRRVRRKRVR